MSSKPITIDCQYIYPQFAAAFLLKEKNEAVFIENNTTHSVPILLEALKQEGMTPSQVRYVIITHVHLDHAGGTSALMKACPNATLLTHPKGARHMIHPEKLVTSARQVYGEEKFEKLYGEISPIDEKRVRPMEDGEEIQWGSRKLQFLHTRGHANHHMCIYDSTSYGIFTGDSFGLAYPMIQQGGLLIFPSTSPTDFDPIEARKSIQKIISSGAQRAYLTHFGEIENLQEAAVQLNSQLNLSEKLMNEASARDDQSVAQLEKYCLDELKESMKKRLEERGITPTTEIWELLRLDLELNAAGIVYSAKKKKPESN